MDVTYTLSSASARKVAIASFTAPCHIGLNYRGDGTVADCQASLPQRSGRGSEKRSSHHNRARQTRLEWPVAMQPPADMSGVGDPQIVHSWASYIMLCPALPGSLLFILPCLIFHLSNPAAVLTRSSSGVLLRPVLSAAGH